MYMTYNIHPIIVHFPIALLFLYSIIKIIPFSKLWPNVSWRHIERALLFVGVFGAIAALITGPIAKELVQPKAELVNAHSNFAYLSAYIFGALLVGELIAIFKFQYLIGLKSEKIKIFLFFLERIFSDKIISKLLAFIGFVSIILTGMLGGVMVYGLSADPFAPIVLKMLGISL